MLVVTLPLSAAKNPQRFAINAKKAGADILEIRGDLTPNVAGFVSPLPLLITPRGQGMRFIERFKVTYLDLDQEEQLSLSKISRSVKIILSIHHYEKTPALKELKKTVQNMYSLKPWMVKFATVTGNYNDVVALLNLQDLLNKKSIQSTVLGMGERSHILRITSLIRNTFTYTFLDGTEPAAPGQLPLSFYHLTKGRKKPKLFGIIGGKQIASSLSPLIHNALFQRHKIDALYSCFPTENFKAAIKILAKIGVVGFSVTAPFKQEAFRLAKKHDAIVNSLGVANTLVKSGTGFHAFNTDVSGIESGYPELKKAKSIAILGAGGAVPSAILAIRHLNPKTHITVFARDTKKAEAALQKFHVAIEPMRSAPAFGADAVLCAISEDISLPIPKAQSSKLKSQSSLAIDLRYNKITSFMRDAAKQGYRVRDGIPMLISQALKQFEYFTGKKIFSDDAEYLRSILITHH